jgi:RNA polymerase sporulation-specific sigma factor
MGYTEMRLPRFPRLSGEEMARDLSAARQGDEGARERLIQGNLRLVFAIASRFQGRGPEKEDLFQIGVIGLIKAIDRFDLSFNVQFSTYAVPMSLGELKRFLRDDGPVKVSRSYKDNLRLIRQAQSRLEEELGREPALAELEARLDMPREVLINSLEAASLPVSLYEPLSGDQQDSLSRLDQLRSRDDEEKAFRRLILEEALERLEPREKEIIRMRFYEDKTQAQVAARLGLSQVQISRLEKGILARCRAFLQDEP